MQPFPHDRVNPQRHKVHNVQQSESEPGGPAMHQRMSGTENQLNKCVQASALGVTRSGNAHNRGEKPPLAHNEQLP